MQFCTPPMESECKGNLSESKSIPTILVKLGPGKCIIAERQNISSFGGATSWEATNWHHLGFVSQCSSRLLNKKIKMLAYIGLCCCCDVADTNPLAFLVHWFNNWFPLFSWLLHSAVKMEFTFFGTNDGGLVYNCTMTRNLRLLSCHPPVLL